MKLLVTITCDVDVPDSALGGGATPEAIAELSRKTCKERVERIWGHWGHSVGTDVLVIGSPQTPKIAGS